MKSEIEHVSILVRGHVQGVFFRSASREFASELGLKGFVCNLPDGRVQIEAEGPPHLLQQLISWAHRGPAGAHVTDVTCTPKKNENFVDFHIRISP